MDLRVFTEPQQGATYDDLLRVARHAEQLGFDAFFRSDHYLAMDVEGLPGPTDAWLTLAGLARDTSTIRLGTLMTSATFRLPGPLAISVAQVDQMSDGHVELGIGAGWYEAEHTAYGIPFPRHRGTIRSARGDARGRHRAVGHADGRDLRLRGPARRGDARGGARPAGGVRRSRLVTRPPADAGPHRPRAPRPGGGRGVATSVMLSGRPAPRSPTRCNPADAPTRPGATLRTRRLDRVQPCGRADSAGGWGGQRTRIVSGRLVRGA
jgi:hypothetical protein